MDSFSQEFYLQSMERKTSHSYSEKIIAKLHSGVDSVPSGIDLQIVNPVIASLFKTMDLYQTVEVTFRVVRNEEKRDEESMALASIA